MPDTTAHALNDADASPITGGHTSIHLFAPPAYAVAADPAIPGRSLADLPDTAADQVRAYLYGQLRQIPMSDSLIRAVGAHAWEQIAALVAPACGHAPVPAADVVADVVLALTAERLMITVRPRALLYPTTCGPAAANCPPEETSTTLPIALPAGGDAA